MSGVAMKSVFNKHMMCAHVLDHPSIHPNQVPKNALNRKEIFIYSLYLMQAKEHLTTECKLLEGAQ